MPDFDELKGDAEKFAQEHPEQVKKGEDAIENKLGIDQQNQGGDQQNQGGKDGSGNQGQ
jgi:hypothetical protein